MERVFVLILCVVCCSTLPLIDRQRNDNMDYMKTFGWFDGKTDDIDDDVALSLKIEEFQEFAGLNVTGTFDEPTIMKMKEPRCGVRDQATGTRVQESRKKRDIYQGSLWNKKSLTYCIGNKTSDLKLSQIKEGIEKATKLWSDESALSFTEVQCKEADLKFDFSKSKHGDGRDFDGPGKTVAHAFFPNKARRGQTHFDEAETWLEHTQEHNEKGSMYNIMIIAAHEIGHVLGLEHTSTSSKSLMNSWPVAYHENYVLPSFDVKSIQNLYGKPGSELTFDLCSDDTKIRIDAVLYVKGPQERTLFFSGIHYWEITSYGGVKKGYPKPLFSLFPSDVAKKIAGMDAIVMSSKTDKIYVFKGDQFWRFNSKFEFDAYSRLIIETGLPDNVDAAYEDDGQLYIVKKKKVFIFDEQKQKAFKEIQKLSKTLPGVPKGVNAAMTWSNGHTYFFRKEKYYKFDRDLGKVSFGFPKLVKGHWICL